ncbi:T9SS sorting signal type C domain-containing protein [Flavobacterium sp. SUN052]|uniref:T9SS sorting signal type C domain-containing protein n=1 Tax=Flavobacterium sp. SUN052 TaxID=3002441 RepID=UPI00237E7B05|nr:T9SS sorting signal type C domain-containing protein [Flavobacterium sp. SUN052]MEC4004766.1 T9SS sorting signal type C domain-containing protein [Flavobacterium sp. SUN052]
MNKKITLIVFLTFFFVTNSFAQLFVSNNSYVFNKGAMVFVNGNVELNGANSNFYLRNEGQLLQGTTTTSTTNKGIGKLSVFQEGTVNNYAYNYWCSPVGNASVATGNESFGISMLNVPTTNVASTPVTILPIGNYDGSSGTGALSIAPYWIWKFLSSSLYSQWFQSAAATNIAPGEGFTMKGTSGSDATNPGESVANNPGSKQRYDFRGKPNDGDITINVANLKQTLTGNPYPSAIDLSAFLTAALNCTGIAYFWEQDKTVNSHVLANYRGGYGTYSPISRGGTGIYVPAKFYAYDVYGNQLGLTSTPNNSYARYFSPIGQGFMIEGNGSGPTVTMKNSYRVYQKENVGTSVFEKSSSTSSVVGDFLPEIQSVSGFDYTTVSTQEVPQIKINALLNNEAIKQVVLAFDESATDSVDHAKDAKNPSDSSPMDMYFVMSNSEYIISVIDFNENKRLPIGFKSNAAATVKITVADMINFNQANNVYLYDNLTGIYHEIKNNQYEFPVESGVTNTRYEITFLDTALNTNANNLTSLSIVQNNDNQLLSVSNPNILDIKSVSLYDVLGKLIFDKVDLGSKNSYEFSTAALSEGIYIVKLKTNNGQSIGQKIIVEKVK